MVRANSYIGVFSMKKSIVLLVASLLLLVPGYVLSADKFDEAAGVLKPYIPAMKRYLYVVENTQDSRSCPSP